MCGWWLPGLQTALACGLCWLAISLRWCLLWGSLTVTPLTKMTVCCATCPFCGPWQHTMRRSRTTVTLFDRIVQRCWWLRVYMCVRACCYPMCCSYAFQMHVTVPHLTTFTVQCCCCRRQPATNVSITRGIRTRQHNVGVEVYALGQLTAVSGALFHLHSKSDFAAAASGHQIHDLQRA